MQGIAEINKDIDQTPLVKDYYPLKALFAFRAVVELHKPIQISNEQLCNACEEWTNEGQKQLFYPCPTIQAIEKELK